MSTETSNLLTLTLRLSSSDISRRSTTSNSCVALSRTWQFWSFADCIETKLTRESLSPGLASGRRPAFKAIGVGGGLPKSSFSGLERAMSTQPIKDKKALHGWLDIFFVFGPRGKSNNRSSLAGHCGSTPSGSCLFNLFRLHGTASEASRKVGWDAHLLI